MPTASLLDSIGNTPLVLLERISRDSPVPLLAKCEHLNPGGSVKDRIARSIVLDAEARGALRPGMTLIEATAGNTGVGLALVAASRGYNLVCVMPEKMSHDKRNALKQLGAQVVITRNAPPSDPDNFQNVARRLAEQNGWFLTEQFNNPANPLAHERTTGPEIVAQTHGALSAFVAGVGTGGTITGVARYLQHAVPHARIVLADPCGSLLASRVDPAAAPADHSYLVEGIGTSVVPNVLDISLIHHVEQISDDESFAMVRRLIREEGLLVGGSAGTAVAAALRFARKHTPASPVVVLLPDAWDRYRSTPWMSALAE